MARDEPSTEPRKRWQDLPFAGEQPVDSTRDEHSAFEADVPDDAPAPTKPKPRPKAPPAKRPTPLPPPRSKGKKRLVLLAVGLVVLVQTTRDNDAVTTQSASYDGIKTVRMVDLAGDVDLRNSTDSHTHVYYKITHPEGLSFGSQAEVVINGELKLANPCEGFIPEIREDCRVTYTVSVPNGTTVDLQQTGEELTVAGMDGTLVALGTGQARVEDYTGSLNLQASGKVEIKDSAINTLIVNGGDEQVEAELERIPTKVSIRSEKDVKLSLPRGAYDIQGSSGRDEVQLCNGISRADKVSNRPVLDITTPEIINICTTEY